MNRFISIICLTSICFLLSAKGILAQEAYPDSLPKIFFQNNDESSNFYTRYGKAYGILFKYKETLNQFLTSKASADSFYAKSEARFLNLYSRPLALMRGFNKFVQIEQSLLAPENKIKKSVKEDIDNSKDTLEHYLRSFFFDLNYWRQDESVQTFSNVFDPAYIKSPMNELVDSFYYYQTIESDSLKDYVIKLKVPASYDKISVPSANGYKFVAGYASGAGCGEFVFSISAKYFLNNVSEDEFKKQIEKPSTTAVVSAFGSSIKRNVGKMRYYKHPNGYYGLKLSFSSLASTGGINVAAQTYSLALPDQNIVLAFNVRSVTLKNEEQVYTLLEKYQEVIDFILSSIYINRK